MSYRPTPAKRTTLREAFLIGYVIGSLSLFILLMVIPV